MKIDTLISKMKQYGVSLPKEGTGMNQRIVARDLVHALGDHFVRDKYEAEPVMRIHCQTRREVLPMKAYRYDKLPEAEKEFVWRDKNGWIAEKKENGWRMLIVFIPGDGFSFWGGNTSDVDFLPVDYTDHILINGKHPRHKDFENALYTRCVIDSEAICHDSVEMLDGLFSNNTLDSVRAILGSDPERAVQLQQEGAELEFHCFDYISWNLLPNFEMKLTRRKECLAATLQCLGLKQFRSIKYTSKAKQQMLNEVWRKGGEGVILKKEDSPYVPGGRLKNINIKVKRSMSGEIGDDVDAFIIGFEMTEEWSKKNLIGSLKLGVFIEEGGERKIHHIATVSAMPDHIREELTVNPYGIVSLNPEYDGTVLTIDGQELSERNQKLMHAKVDWNKGFREDKSREDCTFELDIIKEERF